MDTVTPPESPIMKPLTTAVAPIELDGAAMEKKGRRWLVWSFIFCPCHLPLSMAVLATVFGTSAFGTMIANNKMGVGLVFGSLYAIGVAIGFIYLKEAAKGKDCSKGACTF